MRHFLPLLCAMALVFWARLPAHAEPTRAPEHPAGAASGGTEPASPAPVGRPGVDERSSACPPLGGNPFDEAPARGNAPVDLNTADESALLGLPGIGPARARAILDFRIAHGGFRSISQLLQIRGIGRALLKQLRPLITL